MSVAFTINGQSFTALNGGPAFKFNEAVSIQVFCDSQEEIDYKPIICRDVECNVSTLPWV